MPRKRQLPKPTTGLPNWELWKPQPWTREYEDVYIYTIGRLVSEDPERCCYVDRQIRCDQKAVHSGYTHKLYCHHHELKASLDCGRQPILCRSCHERYTFTWRIVCPSCHDEYLHEWTRLHDEGKGLSLDQWVKGPFTGSKKDYHPKHQTN